MEWAFSQYGKRVYLVGSDYVYPRAANAILKDQAHAWQGQIVGEQYQPLGSQSFDDIVDDIRSKKPDVIFNTINGKSNIAFFDALRNVSDVAGVVIPTVSFSLTAGELVQLGRSIGHDDHVVLSYFPTNQNSDSTSFTTRFKQHYPESEPVNNAMLNAYLSVHLWAKSVAKAGTSHPQKLHKKIGDLSILGPSGMVYVEKNTQHTWRTMHIARLNQQGALTSEWFSKIPIAPIPYPSSRTRAQWQTYLAELQQQWQGQWQAAVQREQ